MIPWALKIGYGFSARKGVGETAQKDGQKSCRLGLLSHAQVSTRLPRSRERILKGFSNRAWNIPLG